MQKQALKILIIDDVPANLALLGMALQDDYQIQIATSGAKGIALALAEPPALILLDIMMPEMDGYETCQRIQAESLLRDIPIIFVTALTELDAEAQGFALGAADYLTKPISIEIARLRIKNLLEREQLRRELRLAASVFAHTHDSVIITDPQNRIIDVNAAFSRITGYSREEVLGKDPNILKSGRQSSEFYQNLWDSLLTQGYWNGEIWNRNKKGEIYAALTAISVVRDERGEIHHFIGLAADITPLKNHEYDLERIAHYDSLTGIPNRLLLSDRLAQAITHTQRAANHMAIGYLDLDGFKPVNDQFGHDVGDLLLIEVARRIKDCLRAGDTVARIGGDEFVLLLLDFNQSDECMTVLSRMLHQVAHPICIDEHIISVSASLGFTIYPDDHADADTLMRHADQAMYVAKQRGKNRCHLFDQEQDRLAISRNETLAQIEAAMQHDEFVLFFQPKVNMRQGKVLGAEALIRWQHPVHGLLPPSAFLPDIEGTELVIALDRWVLERALQHLEHWHGIGLDLSISINIAPRHLLHQDFVNTLEEHFKRHPTLPRHCLELEILESAALEDINCVIAVMKECQKLGILFALDDFGTGYSSLTYLKALPAETLKVDQSFIRDILHDPEDLAIVSGIINLANVFHRKVIAEGVETHEHGSLLLTLGCEQAQGYGIARPMPASELADWIEQWSPCDEWRQANRSEPAPSLER